MRVAASVMRSFSHRGLDEPERHVSRLAALQAYEATGLGPEDMDVAEVHDASAMGEILQSENLGLVPLGGGGRNTPARLFDRRSGAGAFGNAAIVTGNVLEDEKAGFHWAYGRSEHLGGVTGPDAFTSLSRAWLSAPTTNTLVSWPCRTMAASPPATPASSPTAGRSPTSSTRGPASRARPARGSWRKSRS